MALEIIIKSNYKERQAVLEKALEDPESEVVRRAAELALGKTTQKKGKFLPAGKSIFQ